MNFSRAFDVMQSGRRMTRVGWNAANQWVEIQLPDEHSKMTLPYVYLTNNHGELFPWFPSNGDLFAEDWVVASP